MSHQNPGREACPTNARKFLIGILGLAFVVRLAVMLLLQTWIFPSERAFGYETGEIGYALANGQGFSWPQTWREVGSTGKLVVKRDHPVPTTWEAPIYPIIVGGAFWFFGSYTAKAAIALELFQSLLSVLGCYVLFRLGKQLFNVRAGLLAAFFLAIYPAAIHFSVQKTEYVTLLTLLGLLLIQQTIQLSTRPSMPGSLALGAISGVATLVNPVVLSFYPFALVWFLWRCQSDWRSRLKYAVAIVVCCAATSTPWIIRNYLVFDRFVFIRSNFTRELVRANFSGETRVLDYEVPDEGQMSTFYNQEAVTLVLQNPAFFLRQVGSRAMRFWTGLPVPNPRYRLVAQIAYYSMLLLGLAGVVWSTRRQQQVQLLIVFLLTMPLPFYMTWGGAMARFRFPIEPILILFASYAVTSALSRLFNLRQPNQHISTPTWSLLW